MRRSNGCWAATLDVYQRLPLPRYVRSYVDRKNNSDPLQAANVHLLLFSPTTTKPAGNLQVYAPANPPKPILELRKEDEDYPHGTGTAHCPILCVDVVSLI
ncbi:hypothetical protein M378DRAFT_173861 [Amanita muscaria Koide BX008]|uniref:Uncharacterized protein n=1 Tax=Amanita muscaria (strain Koide BX008) TaxID=946122 RepID=A0A0C2WET2_AMAMK|nr:hypothetical protein M378DRAFT_173861 [Amanita muscaria Koide BX008]